MPLAITPEVDTGPTSERRTTVLALAGVTAAVEAAAVAGYLLGLPIGALVLSPSLIPALALGVACGPRLLGRSASRERALVFWCLIGATLAVLAVLYAHDGRLGLFTSLSLAALGEELVYRLAIPAVIAAALRLGNVRQAPARIAGLIGAALCFVLLPGHVEQMGSLAGILPFAAFATLSMFVVYRSGSVLPMAAVHAVSNLLTVLMWRDAVPADARSLGVSCALAVLVIAYGRPRPITVGDDGGLVDTRTGLEVVSIDLRDGQPATVTLADGRVVSVHDDLTVPSTSADESNR